MALKDLLPSRKWVFGFGIGAGLAGAGGVAAGMVLNQTFASFVLGLSIAGVSLGGLGLPLIASVAIAAVLAGVGAFVAGAAIFAVANTAMNVLASVVRFCSGLFSSGPSNPQSTGLSSVPKSTPTDAPSHFAKLGGSSPEAGPEAVMPKASKSLIVEDSASSDLDDRSEKEVDLTHSSPSMG